IPSAGLPTSKTGLQEKTGMPTDKKSKQQRSHVHPPPTASNGQCVAEFGSPIQQHEVRDAFNQSAIWWEKNSGENGTGRMVDFTNFGLELIRTRLY
ncbi:unnamed protein product, partial [Nesidiocoris tenuis]